MELHGMLMHITLCMLSETRCFITLEEPSMYAKQKFLIDCNLSLNLQQILHFSKETPSPWASTLKSNHVKVLSDLSLSCIHF